MEDCVFCKIVEGELPSTKVYEDEEILAFRDLSPAAPTHIIIVPKKHIMSLDTATDEDMEIIGKLMLKARDIARDEGLSHDGYRIVNNTGKFGGQTVWHYHLHLIGGRAMQWPPG